MKAASDVKRQM